MKGLKDKKIRILTSKAVKIPGQGSKKQWFKFNPYKLWAYYREMSQAEYYAASASAYKVDAIFRIPFTQHLSHKHVIIFQGKVYDIKRIDYFEGNKEDITLYATASTIQNEADQIQAEAEQNGYYPDTGKPMTSVQNEEGIFIGVEGGH